jgi:hypothetical protein
MVDIDSETLFNVAAALVATLAVLVFVLSVDLGHSPASEIALVALFLTGVFALTQRTDDSQLRLLGYGVVVTSVVAVFVDVVNTFGVGAEGTVLGLLVIAAALFGLRTRLDGGDRFLTGRQALYALVAVGVLTAGVLAVDVATGGPTYELRTASEVTVEDPRRGDLRVGSVAVRNPTPLPERVDTPEYRACAAGNWSAHRPSSEARERPDEVRVNLNVQDGYGEHVLGFGSKTYPVVLYLDGSDLRGASFPVERTSSCPDEETGAPYLALYEASEERTTARPV